MARSNSKRRLMGCGIVLEPSRAGTYVEYPYLEYSHGDRAL